MGIATVAVYSDADAESQHVKMADESVALGGIAARESYLQGEKIIAACRKTGAQAVHPGYGFLSENAEFAEACKKAGIVFIGPPASAIRAMGSKSAAKALMEKAKVPVVPGYHGEDQSPEFLKKIAAKIGYPVLLKAVSGGGGKGMRRVDHEGELEAAIAGAAREAQSSFGDARVLLEKYIVNPRHIEIQVFADNFGNTVYLFERDCSIQRRHQKVVEEAPAPGISEKQRTSMGKAAVDAAKAVGYSGAGTVEFIADQSGNFYFMEMNTRLQVEHPVTEMITGLDLVECQIRVARGEKLHFSQNDLKINGHAIEVRLYAEDPARDFLPAIGMLHHLCFPTQNSHVRIDSGVVTGDAITPYYDPMIAKIITWDKSRDDAVDRMKTALAQTEVAGLATNLDFLRHIIGHQAFYQAKLSTAFIEKHRADLFPEAAKNAGAIAAALVSVFRILSCNAPSNPWQAKKSWRIGGFGQSNFYYLYNGVETLCAVLFTIDGFSIVSGKFGFDISDVSLSQNTLTATIDGHLIAATIVSVQGGHYAIVNGHSEYLETLCFEARQSAAANDGGLLSPMPGKVVQIMVSANQNVEKGQALLILEAMKMEHTIKSPQQGKVAEIYYKVGEQVAAGVELLSIESGK